MRRVIKPFAVEIRGGGRKSRVTEPKPPAWPELADQPTVEWPDALLPSTAVSEPVQAVERVAPSQAVVPAACSPELYRDPRKPPPARAIVPVATAPEMQPERPPGRVLLAIDEPGPVKAEPIEEIATARASTVCIKRAKAIRVPEVAAVEPVNVPEVADSAVADAYGLAERRGADRLARADFKRGERWKARLPAAVHQVGKRRMRLPP